MAIRLLHLGALLEASYSTRGGAEPTRIEILSARVKSAIIYWGQYQRYVYPTITSAPKRTEIAGFPRDARVDGAKPWARDDCGPWPSGLGLAGGGENTRG